MPSRGIPLLSKRSFLTAAGQLAAAAAAASWSRSVVAATPLPLTPPGDLGPFFPIERPIEVDADLTRVRGKTARATGELVEVSGRVLTSDGTPQPHARLELWQANATGRYAHPNDRRTDVPLDPNFQGYADLRADAAGNFRFLTIKPGSYGAGTFRRSPHIHLDVRGRSQRLVTQIYFPGDDELQKQDKVLLRDLWGKSPPFPASIFLKPESEPSKLAVGATRYRFDVVLFDGVL